MKTPEEIKKWLGCCISIRNGECEKYAACGQCPFFTTNVFDSDALAYIRQLEAQGPKWISVEERLPEHDEEVLICARSKKTHIHTIAMTSYTLHKHGFNIEGWNEPWQYFNYDWVITHWMPLPEPPKEG